MSLSNPAVERAAQDRVLPAVWKLLFLRLRITYNGFRHARLRTKIRTVVLWALVLGFAYFILSVSRWMLVAIQSPDFARYVSTAIDLHAVLASIPALTLSALFVMTLLTSFGVLLQALYLSGDMDFLLATPVPIRAVFITKMLQAVLPNFMLFCLFGIPILFGLGISKGYASGYYILAILLLIVLALAAAGLSSLLVMLVVRVLPPRRAAEILGFAGAMFGLLCSQIGNVANTFGKDINISGTRLAGILYLSNVRWLPLSWAGLGLVDVGEGQWLIGGLLLAATFAVALLTFWFALVTAERWYYSGWARMQVVARKKVTRPVRTNLVSQNGNGLARILPKPVFAIVQKDFLTMRRDLRNMSQLISPVIFGALYTLFLLRGNGTPPGGRGAAPGWFTGSFRLVLAYGNIGMSLFVGWMLLSRLAAMGFSHEGRNYWMLKAAPVRAWQLLASKFLVAYLPALSLGFVFLTIISVVQKLSFLMFAYGLFATMMCLAGITGILLAFGVAGANFTWDDPRRMSGGVMGCLGQIVSMLYLPISFGLFVAPLGFASYLDIPTNYGYLIGLILGSAVTLAFAVIPLWLVRQRVERLGTE